MQALAASCEELRARTGNPPLGTFLKQLDQFMLQYYSFKAENIAKQQKC
jgi:hypothetical protein